MSQIKVDRNKEQKRNREKIAKQEKREIFLFKTGAFLIAVVFVAWIGFSAYGRITNPKVGSGTSYSVDTSALDTYLNSMAAEAQ